MPGEGCHLAIGKEHYIVVLGCGWNWGERTKNQDKFTRLDTTQQSNSRRTLSILNLALKARHSNFHAV